MIVCEGEKTEPNYFEKFKGKYGNVIFEIDCGGKGYNTLKVVEEAINQRQKILIDTIAFGLFSTKTVFRIMISILLFKKQK